MRHSFWVMLVVPLIVTAYADEPPVQAPINRPMTFDEEFDHLPSKLTSTSYWWGRRWIDQDEKQVYVDPSYRGTALQPLQLDPLSIQDGILQIQASIPAPTVAPYLQGQKYISGLLTSYKSFSQRYGYFEIRAQIPPGKGFWPTFWLLPKVIMPHPPEIDILEARGDRLTNLYVTAHYNEENTPKMTTFTIAVPDMSATFHRYGVLWTEQYIAWYFDGERAAFTHTPADLHSPMCLLLNLAVGGRWPGQPNQSTPFPGNFLIDYIRVYAAN